MQPWVKSAETRLRSFGLMVVPSATGSLEGQLPLPKRVAHPYTGASLNNAHFVLLSEFKLRLVSPPILQSLDVIDLQRVSGRGEIAAKVESGLSELKRAMTSHEDALAALGVRSARIDETGETIANVDVYGHGKVVLLLERTGIRISHLMQPGGGQLMINELLDIRGIESSVDFGFLLDHMVDRFKSRLAAAPAVRSSPAPEFDEHGLAPTEQRPNGEPSTVTDAGGALAGAGYDLGLSFHSDTRDLSASGDGEAVSTAPTTASVNGELPRVPLEVSGPTLAQLEEFFPSDTQMPLFESRSVFTIEGRVIGVQTRMNGGHLTAIVHEGGAPVFKGNIPAAARSLESWVRAVLKISVSKPALELDTAKEQAAGALEVINSALFAETTSELFDRNFVDLGPNTQEGEAFVNAGGVLPGFDEESSAFASVTDETMRRSALAPEVRTVVDERPLVESIERGTYWNVEVQPKDPTAMIVRYTVLDRNGRAFGAPITIPQSDFEALFRDDGGRFVARVRVTGLSEEDLLYVHVDEEDRMLSNPIATSRAEFLSCFSLAAR